MAFEERATGKYAGGAKEALEERLAAHYESRRSKRHGQEETTKKEPLRQKLYHAPHFHRLMFVPVAKVHLNSDEGRRGG